MGAFFAGVGLEPVVLEDFLGGEAGVGVYVYDAFEEVEAFVGEVVTDHFVVASLDSAVEFGIGLAFEWEVAV